MATLLKLTQPKEAQMNESETKQLLDELAELRAQNAQLVAEKQARYEQIVTPEIKAALEALEAEFAPSFDNVSASINEKETAVKSAVLELGKTVKGAILQAVFSKGRVSWDTKALDGYAVANPDVLQFKKEGAPSVSIRG
jgi:hypothetical protein